MQSVALLDLGIGNLHSMQKALEREGAKVILTGDIQKALDTSALIFPGVGSFEPAMRKLRPARDELVSKLEAGMPALGICIGSHILLEKSEEGDVLGLGFIKGRATKLNTPRVPHMGWNSVSQKRKGDPIFESIPDESYFYFVHSYSPLPSQDVTIGETRYGELFPSVIRKKNAYGIQFHPEKSSDNGLAMISNFMKIVKTEGR